MTPLLIILMLSGAIITAIGGVLANWLNRPDWATPGRVMAALAAVAIAATAVAVAIESKKDQSNGATNSYPSASPTPNTIPTRESEPSASESRGPSKAAYLTGAEKSCAENRNFTTAMPDRALDPEAFGAWLVAITSSNQAVLDGLTTLDRPTDDENALANLFAQRERANELFLRSAEAFKAGERTTGEQFLNDAISVEEDYRKAAKEYGFSICVGSDTPGR